MQAKHAFKKKLLYDHFKIIEKSIFKQFNCEVSRYFFLKNLIYFLQCLFVVSFVPYSKTCMAAVIGLSWITQIYLLFKFKKYQKVSKVLFAFCFVNEMFFIWFLVSIQAMNISGFDHQAIKNTLYIT